MESSREFLTIKWISGGGKILGGKRADIPGQPDVFSADD